MGPDFYKNMLDSDFQTFGLFIKGFLNEEYCQELDVSTLEFLQDIY